MPQEVCLDYHGMLDCLKITCIGPLFPLFFPLVYRRQHGVHNVPETVWRWSVTKLHAGHVVCEKIL